MDGFRIELQNKHTVKMSKVCGSGFSLHTQIAVAEVVVRGGLKFMSTHGKEPTTHHD